MKRLLFSSGYRRARRVAQTLFFAAAITAAAPSPSFATILPPTGFGPDSGSALFVNVAPGVVNVEIADALGGSLPAVQTTFGFYFASNPAGLIPIFDPTDQGSSTVHPAALIDFVNRRVVDVDAGNTLQTDFSAVPGTGPFGFFLQIFSPGNPPTVPPTLVRLFSDPGQNGGNDPVATFPSLTVPNQFLIGFEGPTGQAIYFDFAANVAPVAEPTTLLLFAMAVAGLGLWCKRARTA